MKHAALAFAAAALLWPVCARADGCPDGQVESGYVDGEHLTTTCQPAGSSMDQTVSQDAASPGDHDAGWDAADTTLPSSDDAPPSGS